MKDGLRPLSGRPQKAKAQPKRIRVYKPIQTQIRSKPGKGQGRKVELLELITQNSIKQKKGVFVVKVDGKDVFATISFEAGLGQYYRRCIQVFGLMAIPKKLVRERQRGILGGIIPSDETIEALSEFDADKQSETLERR